MAGSLSGRRILMVVAPTDFRDEELFVPKGRFEAEGLVVEIASTDPGRARGTLGAEVTPDLTIAEADPRRYAAIVVVGGKGTPVALWQDDGLHALLRTAYRRATPIGAICLAPVVLARAGLLKAARATVSGDPRAKRELVRGGARFVDDDVVVDHEIVTASGPDAARAFADALLRVLRAAVSTRFASDGREARQPGGTS
jgi:deglycase